ncbi:MAG: F0F1 ATP synthase subunit B [candidate division KSB1 bacterium]|nr:F0F1 ATP synthase subunit B [candidate division KSB1 bacterium]
MDLLSPETGTMFWTALTFLLLLLVLGKLAWKPLVSALNEREQRIRESLEKAEEAQRQAEKNIAEYQAMLEKARAESQEIIERSRKTAETMREEIVENAKKEAERLLERAKKEIALEREKAVDEIRKLAVDLSLIATRKAIGKTLTPKDHEALIQEALKEIGDSN